VVQVQNPANPPQNMPAQPVNTVQHGNTDDKPFDPDDAAKVTTGNPINQPPVNQTGGGGKTKTVKGAQTTDKGWQTVTPSTTTTPRHKGVVQVSTTNNLPAQRNTPTVHTTAPVNNTQGPVRYGTRHH
jgi:hypothetical protein